MNRSRKRKYVVVTTVDPDSKQPETVDYISGLRAACAFAKKAAYSHQAQAFVKNARTGKEAGAYRFAINRDDVVGRGACR